MKILFFRLKLKDKINENILFKNDFEHRNRPEKLN